MSNNQEYQSSIAPGMLYFVSLKQYLSPLAIAALGSISLYFIYPQLKQKMTKNKTIIYCVSTPRSRSTAFFRMMEARGDFACFEELGVDAYTRIYEPEACDIICEGHKPKTFIAAESFLMQALNDGTKKPVFVKEMGFAARHYLFSGSLGDINRQKAFVLFLVRNPHAALISLYRKRPENFRLLHDWMDYKALWQLYEQTRDTYTHKPLIIISEELCTQPERIVRMVCAHCSIPFNPSHLHWDALATTMSSD